MSLSNSFSLIGILTKDPVLGSTISGTATCAYTIACHDFYADKSGVMQESVSFIPVKSYGKQAERDAKYLTKGALVTVSGQINSWYKAEEKRGGFNFNVNEVKYLRRASNSNQSAASESTSATPGEIDHNNEHAEWLCEFSAEEKF